MAKTAWGIELGTSSVKAVKLSGDRGGVSLEDVAIVSLNDFGLNAGTTSADATAGALNELRSSHGIKKGDEVYVSISGQNTLGRIISLPPVSKERVRETIENEARSQIPIKLEEAVWDFQIIEDDEDPDELRVNLYAAKKEVVNEIIEICDMAGLSITGVQVAPLGIYNYIKYEMDDAVSDACVAIDIGADNTDVVIIDGQKTYVRVVPVAGNDITKALRARFKLQIDDAEKLKRRAHKSKDAAAVFEAMKPPLKDMVGEIYRAVGFYKSQHEDANVNQLVMMGNGSKLLNIKKFFEQQLQFQVHKVDTPVRIALARAVDPTEVQNNIQSLTVAIGLGLQGLGLDEVNRINLIPPEYVEAQETEKLRVPFFAAGAIAAAGGLIGMLLAIFATGGVSTTTDQATSTQSQAQSQRSEFETLTDVTEFENKAWSLRNLAEGAVAVAPAVKPDEDDPDDTGDPARQLTLLANKAPGMIARTVHDALAEYITDGSPRTPIYYANMANPSNVSGLPFQNSAMVMHSEMVPEWRADPDDPQQGHWVATRTFRYEVRIASLLRGGVGDNDAHRELDRKLVDDRDGLVYTRLRDAIFKHFEETGQLEGIEGKRRESIELEGIEVSITRRSAQSDVGKEHYLVTDIVQTATMEASNDGETWRADPIFKMFTNDARFSVNNLVVTVTLAPVEPPSEDGDEEEEDDQ